jgi:hypothetical protein
VQAIIWSHAHIKQTILFWVRHLLFLSTETRILEPAVRASTQSIYGLNYMPTALRAQRVLGSQSATAPDEGQIITCYVSLVRVILEAHVSPLSILTPGCYMRNMPSSIVCQPVLEAPRVCLFLFTPYPNHIGQITHVISPDMCSPIDMPPHYRSIGSNILSLGRRGGYCR